MLRLVKQTCLSFTFVSLWVAFVVAKEGDEQDFEMTSIEFTVQDESGDPIHDARVRCYAMRCFDENAHFGWPAKVVGESESVKSDTRGLVTVSYPNWWRRDAGTPFRTRLITVSIRHPSYISAVVHFALTDDPVLTLRKGIAVEMSPVDTDGEPITRARPVCSGKSPPEEWSQRDGKLVTGCAEPGNLEMMLVGFDASDRFLFSETTPLIFEEGQDVSLGEIELSLGYQIHGEISDNVPRPVLGGHVVGVFQPLLPLEGWQTLTWRDTARINEDGSFKFQSVSRGGYAQLIAFCDGWVIENGRFLDEPRRTIGHRIDINQQVVKPVLPMIQMFSVEVTAVDDDGKPAKGIRLGFNPNQFYMDGGSTILGQVVSHRGWLENQLNGTSEPHWKGTMQKSFYGQTDENGNVRLTNVPEYSLHRLRVSDTRFPNSQADTDGLAAKIAEAKKSDYKIELNVIIRP